MKKQMINIKTILIMTVIASLSLMSWKAIKEEYPTFENEIPFTGSYSWSFEIPEKGVQTSTYVFYPYSIQYKMKGPAFSTAYTQVLVDYNPEENRCITMGRGGTISKDSVYFVMFFKKITDSTLTIYKHECKNGKKEAEEFKFPSPDTEEDHGWNVYKKNTQ